MSAACASPSGDCVNHGACNAADKCAYAPPDPPPRQGLSSRLAVGSRDDWGTPELVLERVRRVGPIALDPCTSLDNPVDAENWFTLAALNPEVKDGLALSWQGFGLAYVNPPYSAMAAWADKVAGEAGAGCEVVTLVAARPDSRWFYRLAWDTARAVCFWKGRLRFVGAPSSAPFPSAIVFHGRRAAEFEVAFQDAGKVVRLR